MVNKLICSIKDGVKKIALLENEELKELYVFKTDKLASGDIVIGRISEKNDNIKAFFVDLGKAGSGFLPINKYNNYKVGDTLAFEIIKEAKDGKHPKLTTNISLAGAFCVYSPDGDGYNIAKSINDEDEKQRLEYIAMDIKPHLEGGLMIRSAAIGINEDVIRKELEFLKAKWQKISSQKELGLSAKGLDSIIFFLAKYKDGFKEIICDNADFLAAIKGWGSQVNLSHDIFSFHAGSEDLFAKFGLDENLDLLLEKEVYLKGGSKITIEPTKALIAIDIDSGGNHNDILNINIEACKEALNQIRLRNLSGQIVIDLIKDRRNPDLSSKVIKNLYDIANNDSVRTRIVGITPLGNIEITRERRFASLYEVLNDNKH